MENKKTLSVTEAIEKQRKSAEELKETLRKVEQDVEESISNVEHAHQMLLAAIQAKKG